MSTYHRERPEYLDAALRSIWADQTRKPDQIVLVQDGLLPPPLERVIERWAQFIGEALCVVRKEKNCGLAAALNDAIEVATGDLLARMDSDDISHPDRFRIQEEYMVQHPEIDILGTGIHEFNDKGTLDNVRLYPATMDDIRARIHRLNPMAHPSVMFRSRFFDTGIRYTGKYYLCEDITLWFDAVCANCKMHNLPNILLDFRRNSITIDRRRETIYSEFCAYNRGIYKLCGLFSCRYIFSLLRLMFRLMPTGISNTIYRYGGVRNKLSR